MKNIFAFTFIALAAATIVSCNKIGDQNPVVPTYPTRSDTSKTLISNTKLVGNWNIVTDTITDNITNQTVTYAGVAGDHYKFTKYGNLYINSAFHSYIDTGVYTISAKNQVQWVNSFISVDGVSTRAQTTAGAFDIILVDEHSLILSQHGNGANGQRYEKVTFSK